MRIGQLFKLLDAVGDEPTLDYRCSVHRLVIPVEEPLLGHHLRPLQQQVLPEPAQDIHNVDPIDGSAPGCDVHLDEAARIKEGEEHLLAAAGLHLCLQWARLALQSPILAHSFGFRCVVGYHGLVHSDNTV